jgi:hypothetical protein
MQRNMGIGNNSGVMAMIVTCGVRQQAVHYNNIALLCLHGNKFFAVSAVFAHVVDWWVETLGVFIQSLNDAWDTRISCVVGIN